MEIFDFRNIDSQKMFKLESSKSNLTKNFKDKEQNLHQQVTNWNKDFQSLAKRCFKKIRLTGKTKESEITNQINERNQLKRKIKEDKTHDVEEYEAKLKQLETEITNKVQDKNFRIIADNFKSMTN